MSAASRGHDEVGVHREPGVEPHRHPANHLHRGALAWTLPSGIAALSSAPVGGGLAAPRWVLNIGVASDYDRHDLAAHAAEVAEHCRLVGPGLALFTAADVDRVAAGRCGDVSAHATVGISKPTWAADPDGGWNPWRPGTINVVAQLPVALSAAAAVNAIITITEAKTQVMLEAGVPGTGTASDAVVVLWPDHGPAEPFAGPRSRWGSPLAGAVHEAVKAGILAAIDERRLNP